MKKRKDDALPPPSEREIELEARIVAVEYLLKQCFWQMILHRAAQEAGNDDDDVTCRMAKKPEPPKPIIWNVYKIASKPICFSGHRCRRPDVVNLNDAKRLERRERHNLPGNITKN